MQCLINAKTREIKANIGLHECVTEGAEEDERKRQKRRETVTEGVERRAGGDTGGQGKIECRKVGR